MAKTTYLIRYVDRFSGEEDALFCTEDRLRYMQAHLRSDGKEIRKVEARTVEA
jgi:hypothetical protein